MSSKQISASTNIDNDLSSNLDIDTFIKDYEKLKDKCDKVIFKIKNRKQNK